MAGGHLGSKGVRFKSEFMKSFPVPPITDANQHLATQMEELVEKIITAKHADQNADTSNFENEIDKLVYVLYDLTPDEMCDCGGEGLNRGFSRIVRITRILRVSAAGRASQGKTSKIDEEKTFCHSDK